MIVDKIPEAKTALTKEIVLNFKRYIAYSLSSLGGVMLGAVMFFYIEECYYMVKIPPQYSQNCKDLCNGIEELNQTISMRKSNHLMNICNSTQCIEVPGKDLTTCKISVISHFLQYFELAFSIVFTIGQYLCTMLET